MRPPVRCAAIRCTVGSSEDSAEGLRLELEFRLANAFSFLAGSGGAITWGQQVWDIIVEAERIGM